MTSGDIRHQSRVEEQNELDSVLEVLNSIEIIILCSIDSETGHPRAVPVVKAYCDGFNEIIISTFKNTHKVRNFLKNPNLASVTIYNTKDTVVLYGHVDVYTELEDLKAHWCDCMGNYFKNGPESEDLAIIKFIPEQISASIDEKIIEKSLVKIDDETNN